MYTWTLTEVFLSADFVSLSSSSPALAVLFHCNRSFNLSHLFSPSFNAHGCTVIFFLGSTVLFLHHISLRLYI